MKKKQIGIALGSGSARGWAHIGVLRALNEMGIYPDIVCGCSAGALIGGAYAAGYLDELEVWSRTVTRKNVISFFDLSLMSGGVIAGDRMMAFFREQIGDVEIESLPLSFAAVATDLATGREVWLRTGRLAEAVRASISLPGIFTPLRRDDMWLVDGGIVNPVPVSICKAMGADVVIAVNLNGSIVGRHLPKESKRPVKAKTAATAGHFSSLITRGLKNGMDSVLAQVWRGGRGTPGLFDVMASSINIMQDRITRSRMASDPPDIMLTPRLEHLGLLEFYRADDAIEEGRRCTLRVKEALAPLAAEK
ncbi:MAG: patatin-like phospholipase RssA [Deltaproteobacteria bacterium]|nr:patatin-like phospholipase RssA [Deltaproteobacteria bacterium]